IAKKVPAADEIVGVFNLPHAVLIADRFAMRDVYGDLNPEKVVVIDDPGDAKGFKQGQVVSKEAFETEKERLKKAGLGFREPTSRALFQPGGPTAYASITLLPSIQFTVPLLLILGALWLSWRAVNMPAFADFLIATEAEMNKVSWTTQKKLVQD